MINQYLIIFYMFINFNSDSVELPYVSYFETVRRVEKISKLKYEVEIGIMANIFVLNVNTPKFKTTLSTLQYSLKNEKKIKIHVKKNSFEIIFAKKTSENSPIH